MTNSTDKWLHRLHILQRLSSKYLYKSLGEINARLQPLEKFSIKKGYHHASHAGIFNDTVNTDEWQKEVYQFAAGFMKFHQYHSVTDVGCGSGYKLLHILGEYETTGIEMEATYHWLQTNYPQEKWLEMETLKATEIDTDLVICSDVIEHIYNPSKLMAFIHSMKTKYFIFSTPERNRVAGNNDYGPPENTSHYREWSSDEFSNFVSQWFAVEHQLVCTDRSVSQVIVCSK